MVQKGSAEDSEGSEWIQEVESFKKRQEVPGKCFWMSEVSGGLKKCMEASEWCREARKFGRVLSSETRKVQEKELLPGNTSARIYECYRT